MIELTGGQEVEVRGAEGAPVTSVRMGLGWDQARNAGVAGTGAPDIDLDATAVQFADGQLFDLAFYNNLRTRDGSVVHQGDNLTGGGEGDDEQITVDLTRVHRPVDRIVFLVSSYQGHPLQWVAHAFCRLSDDRGTELARFTLTLGVQETGLVMATLIRDAFAGWRLRAVGEGVAITNPTQGLQKLRPFL